MLRFLTYLVLFLPFVLTAQLPDTEIWLIALEDSAGRPVLRHPLNITSRVGYDNQPSFSPDSKSIFYSSVQDTQADIYKYDIRSKKTSRLTFTPESEYSPTVMPGAQYYSVVRVEMDSTQRLWKFPLSGKGEPVLVMEKIKGVGYHAWLKQDSVAVFLLTEPFSLQTCHTGKQELKFISANPGRAFARLPMFNFIYLEKQNSQSIPDTIHLYSSASGKVYANIPALSGAEDFAVVTFWDEKKNPFNAVFMCSGSVVYMQWIGEKSKKWLPVGDLSGMGISHITRVAVSPDRKWIAVVSNHKK
ncbi:MAG: PD40 domain-containing protein [Bacteroidia bacterium]|nr:PD40 domain-containing protein [Bacteroidia bacterium]